MGSACRRQQRAGYHADSWPSKCNSLHMITKHQEMARLYRQTITDIPSQHAQHDDKLSKCPCLREPPH